MNDDTYARAGDVVGHADGDQRDWIVPYVDMLPDNCIPDFGMRVLVCTDMDGNRIVKHQMIGAGEGVDSLLAIGLLESMKHQVVARGQENLERGT